MHLECDKPRVRDADLMSFIEIDGYLGTTAF